MLRVALQPRDDVESGGVALRPKSIVKITEVENTVCESSSILRDRIGLLPQRLSASRKNPFADPVREVRVRIETGKV
jgi:hypothetical protein